MSAQIADIQARSESWNVRLVGHHDLNGHGDGMQLLKNGRYVYIAHLGTSPMALTIVDAADPSDPRVVKQLPHPPNTHAHKVQIAGDVLIQNQEHALLVLHHFHLQYFLLARIFYRCILVYPIG